MYNEVKRRDNSIKKKVSMGVVRTPQQWPTLIGQGPSCSVVKFYERGISIYTVRVAHDAAGDEHCEPLPNL